MLHSAFLPLAEHGEWFRLDGKLLAIVGDVFGRTFGKRGLSDDEIDRVLNNVVGEDEPPNHLLCSDDEWIDSCDTDELCGWLADRAWASYQQGLGR